MRRRLSERLQYVRRWEVLPTCTRPPSPLSDCGYVRVGPLVITTWPAFKATERNAFEVGMVCGRTEEHPAS